MGEDLAEISQLRAAIHAAWNRLLVLERGQPALFAEDPGGVVSLLVDFFCDGIVPAGAVPQPTDQRWRPPITFSNTPLPAPEKYNPVTA